jgi:hypothetical protein
MYRVDQVFEQRFSAMKRLAGGGRRHAPELKISLSNQLSPGIDLCACETALGLGWNIEPVLACPFACLKAMFSSHPDYQPRADAVLKSRTVSCVSNATTASLTLALLQEANRRIIGRCDLLVAITDFSGAGPTWTPESHSGTESCIHLALRYDVRVLWIDGQSGGEPRWVDLRPPAFQAIMQLSPKEARDALRAICKEADDNSLQAHANAVINSRLQLLGLEAELCAQTRPRRLAQWCASRWDLWFARSFEPSGAAMSEQRKLVEEAERRAKRLRGPIRWFLPDLQVVFGLAGCVLSNRWPSGGGKGKAKAVTPTDNASSIVVAFETARKGNGGDPATLSAYSTHLQGLHRFSFLATALLVLCLLFIPKCAMLTSSVQHRSSAGGAVGEALSLDADRAAAEALQSDSDAAGQQRGSQLGTAAVVAAAEAADAQRSESNLALLHPAQHAAHVGWFGSTRSWVVEHSRQIFEWSGFISLLLALGLYGIARSRAWQERAVDIRVVSERLRHAPIMVLLGIDPGDLAEQPPHYAEHDAQRNWIGTAYRERLIAVLFDQTVGAARTALSASSAQSRWDQTQREVLKWLDVQIQWLDKTALSYRSAGLLFEHVCRLLLIPAIALHAVGMWYEWSWAVFAAATLPVFCVVIGLIGSQAELGRMASRYRALSYVLNELKRQIILLHSATTANEAVRRALVVEALRAALAEAFEWRLIHRFHPIHSPV